MQLGIQTKKDHDFPKWYTELITKCDLIEYTDIGGCYVIKPYAYRIWEFIQSHLDKNFKTLGVENAYFPLFISQKTLEKEKDHIADFAPEVAWVTYAGNIQKYTPPETKVTDEDLNDEFGNRYVQSLEQKIRELQGELDSMKVNRLEEPIAVRPTSETNMYPHYAKWISSHRDLPLKLNQWNNVVRWEFKQATPFIRSREFLWQEGHTCFSNQNDAIEEVETIIRLYQDTYLSLLAIPTIRGTKTQKEKFAGADFTKTIEAFIPTSGKAIQAATSHHLGQNFSKMFNIVYEDESQNKDKQFVFQNSWGFTTRSIGIMLMIHSDDRGLVLPPPVAPIQIMIVPIYKKGKEQAVDEYAFEIMENFKCLGLRVKYDDRKNYRPGFKYNECENKGIPIRIDIGLRDFENRTFDVTRRDMQDDNGKCIKERSVTFDSVGIQKVRNLLLDIHTNLAGKASEQMYLSIMRNPKDLDQAFDYISRGKIVAIDFCGEVDCEESIKEKGKERDITCKSLCVPDEDDYHVKQLKCFNCEKELYGKQTLFGKSY